MATTNRLLLVGFAVVVLAACGSGSDANRAAGEGDSSFTVSADDGSASLMIPMSALPEGVAPDDISVTRVTDAETADGTGDLTDTAIYALEPDGLQLGNGAVLTTEIETPDGHLPTVIHLGSGEMPVDGSDEPFTLSVEVVEGTSVIYDVEGGTALLSVPVQHFSTLVVRWKDDFAFFQASGIPPGIPAATPVGQKPAVAASVILKTTSLTSGDYPGRRSWEIHMSEYEGWPSWFYLPSDTLTHFKEHEGKKGTMSLRFELVADSATIVGTMGPGTGTDVLSPTRVVADRPPLTPLLQQFTVPNTDFVCSKVGRGDLDFILEVKWFEKWELQRSWDPTWRQLPSRHRSQLVIVRRGVTCVAPDVTTTTSSTTTTLPPDTTTTTSSTTTTLPPDTTTTTSSTTTTLPPDTTTTTTTTAVRPTSKQVTQTLDCPQPINGTSYIDVNIPVDAKSPSHVVVAPNPWGCPDTEVQISGAVTIPGVYRVTFTATAGIGAPAGTTVPTTVRVNWTNP